MTESTDKAAEPLLLGKVSGPFGVQGWVKLFSYTEPREAILKYRDCLLERRGEWVRANWIDGKRHGKTVIAHLEGVDDRESAEGLVGAKIGIRRNDLPEVTDGQYYWSDLQGLEVVHRDGRSLGRVDYLLATGAHDVMVVKGDCETLIPFVLGEYILDVDLANGLVRVDWEWD